MTLRIRQLTFALVAAIAFVTDARAADSEVEIVGKTPNSTLLVWEVTNRGSDGLSRIEIPVYRANRYDPPPDGWEVERFDRLEHGWLIFVSTGIRYDLRLGQKAKFKCILDQRGLDLRNGTVKVGFRDGKEIEISGVLLPRQQSFFQIFGLPIFLGVLFLLFVLSRLLRRSKSKPAAAAGADAPSE